MHLRNSDRRLDDEKLQFKAHNFITCWLK